MKKKKIAPIIGIFLLILVIALSIPFLREITRIQVKGIENFSPKASTQKTYLLFYPSDIRVSQKNTLVKEVNTEGKVLQEYTIKDSSLRRFFIHQKPTQPNLLYISLFGEATYDNYYFTYDIANKKFQRVDIDYFPYITGVEHIMHYGEDVLFQTLVSHKTGEQNFDMEKMSFQKSISNFSTQQSFETEYGAVPKSTPLVQFQNKILYGAAGYFTSAYSFRDFGIAYVDMDAQTVDYRSTYVNESLIPVYANEEYAYISDGSTVIYQYDKNFKYRRFKPFREVADIKSGYPESCPPLFLDKEKALYAVNSETDGFVCGIMQFRDIPSFEVLKKDYLQNITDMRFLYQNHTENEVYLIRSIGESHALLVLDSQTLDLIHEIPIKQPHLLDFVMKN